MFFACVILLNKMPKTAVVPLTFRQLSKEDSHFLVKYHEDGELQVRSRSFVLTQAKVLFEPRYEKTSFLHICECFRYTLLLSISVISSLCLSSVTVQPGLGQTWSETEDGFSHNEAHFCFVF